MTLVTHIETNTCFPTAPYACGSCCSCSLAGNSWSANIDQPARPRIFPWSSRFVALHVPGLHVPGCGGTHSMLQQRGEPTCIKKEGFDTADAAVVAGCSLLLPRLPAAGCPRFKRAALGKSFRLVSIQLAYMVLGYVLCFRGPDASARRGGGFFRCGGVPVRPAALSMAAISNLVPRCQLHIQYHSANTHLFPPRHGLPPTPTPAELSEQASTAAVIHHHHTYIPRFHPAATTPACMTASPSQPLDSRRANRKKKTTSPLLVKGGSHRRANPEG